MARKNGKQAFCPECGMTVVFKSLPKLGQSVNCRHCGTSLEVVELYPIELDWAFDDSYDDDSDDDYEYSDFEYDDMALPYDDE